MQISSAKIGDFTRFIAQSRTSKLVQIAVLVGGFNTSEKILVSWDDYSQYMEK
jgi:hypothetical protein